ncbi:hypothetical protein MKD38_25485 [Cupriavidus sp. WGlv3]|uniref:hypothetical protein n=1 Tax=Cupriavidus sp. WGlv3 TaxID=2919924 RepID=UPI002090BCA5|nr:hypothetical protein [Cupriavidus sp. WGlv3]MCO4865049.1 hypothetical protein [Cupriavidus sp. WGlv3]
MATPMAGAAANAAALAFYCHDVEQGAYENRIKTIGIRIRKRGWKIEEPCGKNAAARARIA